MPDAAIRILETIPWTPGCEGSFPGERRFIELGEAKVPMVFCWCPPSSETAGLGGFWIAQHPVNQAQWMAVMGGNPSRKSKGDLFPVDSVSWDDAQKFCRNGQLRLPSEAEWEYACRAGTTGEFGVGMGEALNSQRANFDGNFPYGSGHKVFQWVYWKTTVEQGCYPPNMWGLHDMHGQLWEWCEDEVGGRARVLRGGSCLNNGVNARSCSRNRNAPDNRPENFGFRPRPSSTQEGSEPEARGSRGARQGGARDERPTASRRG